MISSGSGSGNSTDASRGGQGLLIETGEVGGVSLVDRGDDLKEEAGEDETAKASRKARTPLVGVSAFFARREALFRGTGGRDGLDALGIEEVVD